MPALTNSLTLSRVRGTAGKTTRSSVIARTGVWADRTKLHAPRFHGQFYDVEGVLPFPRSPQGHPVLVQAGQSAAGVALAARYAEVVFSGPPSLEAAVAFRTDLHAQAAAVGRDPDQVLVLPALMVTLGGTEAEAQARAQRLEDMESPEFRWQNALYTAGLDPDGFDPDAPLPARAVGERIGARPAAPNSFMRQRVRARTRRYARSPSRRAAAPARRTSSGPRSSWPITLSPGKTPARSTGSRSWDRHCRRNLRHSSITSYRSCSAAVASAPSTPVRRCAIISAWSDRRSKSAGHPVKSHLACSQLACGFAGRAHQSRAITGRIWHSARTDRRLGVSCGP